MNLKFLPFLLALSLIACCIEVDISVPSFPEMARYFNVPEGIIQLTIAYNFLGFCISALIYGPLSEAFGRRKVMVIGNALLTIGAIGCVYAESVTFLLASRFVQGLGAATSAVVAFAIVADVYKGHAAVRIIGLMNSIITVIMAIAPVAGAFINKAIGFRGNYACVAIISIISWILIFTFLPETKRERDRFSLKKVLLDYKKLLSSGEFMSTSAAPSLTFCAYISFIAAASFLYMNTFGLSIVSYALHQGVIVGAFAVVSLLSGKIIEKFNSRNCVIGSTAFFMLGSILLLLVSLIAPNSPYLTTASFTVFAIGCAIMYPIIFSQSMEVFSEIKGTSSSAIMSMRTLLCSGFVGLMGYLYDGTALTVSFIVLLANILALGFIIKILRSSLKK